MRRPPRTSLQDWIPRLRRTRSEARPALPARRRLLPLVGLLLLVLLAGCSAPGSLSMEPVTDAELVDRASRSLDRPGPAGDSGEDEEAATIRSAIENGSATIESPSPPIREGLPFEYGGAYHDLTWTVVDERTENSVSFLVDYNATDPRGERVAYEDLPAADRRAVEALLPPRVDRRVDGYELGASTRYNDSELERSVLVSGEPTVVVFEGEAYPVKFDGTSEMTIHTYRYTATEVAEDADAYARDLKSEYLFTLSGLSESERSVVDAAVEDNYYAEDTDDEAFRSVLDRFRSHDAVVSEEAHGEWLVRYDGEVYWAGLWYDGFARDGGPERMSGAGSESR